MPRPPGKAEPGPCAPDARGAPLHPTAGDRPPPMTARFHSGAPRALLALALLTAPLTACDSAGDDGPADGTFDATVSGDAQASLGGQAAFASTTEDGQTVTAVGLIDRGADDDAAFLVFKGRPTAKAYTVASEDVGALLVLQGTGDEGDLYVAETGTVTVSRSETARLSGSFDVTAVNLFDEDDTVRLRGSFNAKPGTVDPPTDEVTLR